MSASVQPRGTSLPSSRLPCRPWRPSSLRICSVKVPGAAPTAEPPRPGVRVQAVRGSKAGGSGGSSVEPTGRWTSVVIGDGGRGSLVNKSINTELLRCKRMAELEDVFTANEAELDPINVATAWMQLGKLRGGDHGQQAACIVLGQRMMGKTLAVAHRMQLRELGSTLWGMGKANFNLDKHPLGAYFAEAAEQVLVSLVNESGSWPGVTASMVWYALGQVPYPWDRGLLDSIAVKTLEGVDSWEDPKILAQIMSGMGFNAVTLTANQKDKLIHVVTRITHDKRESRELCRALEFILRGAYLLHIYLPHNTLQQLHNIALQMPVPYALELRRANFAGILYHVCQRGFQPTTEEAELWCKRLMDDFGPNWTCMDLTWTMLALSSVQGYKPQPSVLQRLRAQLLRLQGFKEGDVSRVKIAMRAWNLRLTDAEVKALGAR
ncbi:hypothetical protein Agub_g1631 [Astrephomene gubernaculifera]|uniref:Uncharacterized protein n=1 Tax=Astrephomene gubernaculifera TaxID=47775 RepID=A0AAD3DHR6_9CHLO|nr:hypothetical protein Agub_g1631 [Astrephomene gubernaculifera]